MCIFRKKYDSKFKSFWNYFKIAYKIVNIEIRCAKLIFAIYYDVWLCNLSWILIHHQLSPKELIPKSKHTNKIDKYNLC